MSLPERVELRSDQMWREGQSGEEGVARHLELDDDDKAGLRRVSRVKRIGGCIVTINDGDGDVWICLEMVGLMWAAYIRPAYGLERASRVP
jgi:hypothetical protein